MTNKSPLHEKHIQSAAKMVDFHGWEMPLNYGSQINEHHVVRQDCGMFDVSHMTVVDILGAGGRQFLRKLLCNDVDQLTHTGKALYSCMLNHHGGIIDDLIVYYRSSDNYRIVLNSATRENDLAWIQSLAEGFAIGLHERNELAMLAVQGPNAIQKTMGIVTAAQADAISTLAPFECVDIDEWFFARTGYTGEDGLEIIVPEQDIAGLWQACLDAGIQPCGLGARDTLRLEAGMLLYGQDMNENTTPLESGLNWTIKWEPEDRDFIGLGALQSQRLQGVKSKLVGLVLEGRGIMRTGQTVMTEEGLKGEITSGTFSPTLQCSVALARVPHQAKEHVTVEIRGKQIPAKITKPRFVKQGKSLL